MVQAFDDIRPRPLRAAPAGAGGRVPPHDLEAEESLLGAMLLSNDAASVGIERCSAGDFYKPAHGHIFGAIQALMERGEAIDAVTVTDELKRSGVLEQVGDPSIFISLQANTPSIANARHYAEIVEEHALLRKLIGVAGEIADIGYSVPEDVKAAVDEAEQMVFNVGRAPDGRHHAAACTSCWARDWTGSRSWGSGGRRSPGWRRGTTSWTGYCWVPAVVAEHRRAPVPGWARRHLRLGVLANVGMAVQRPALLFSLEMGHLELTQRLLASEAEVNGQTPADGADPDAGLEQDRHGGDAVVRARRSSSTTTPTSR